MQIKGNIKIEGVHNFWINDVRPSLDKALELTPEDKLEWAPQPNMITLGNIFMHISESSDFWITTIIDRMESIDYTPCPCPPKEEILRLMENHWQRLEKFFMRAPEILEKNYERERRGKKVNLSGEWIMFHLLEHDIHHRSQANHYLRMLGIQPPQI